MNKELKPCPFCGSDKVEVKKYRPQDNEVYTYFSTRYAILCRYYGDVNGCGAESGHFKSEDEAIEYWNTRE